MKNLHTCTTPIERVHGLVPGDPLQLDDSRWAEGEIAGGTGNLEHDRRNQYLATHREVRYAGGDDHGAPKKITVGIGYRLTGVQANSDVQFPPVAAPKLSVDRLLRRNGELRSRAGALEREREPVTL